MMNNIELRVRMYYAKYAYKYGYGYGYESTDTADIGGAKYGDEPETQG